MSEFYKHSKDARGYLVDRIWEALPTVLKADNIYKWEILSNAFENPMVVRIQSPGYELRFKITVSGISTRDFARPNRD